MTQDKTYQRMQRVCKQSIGHKVCASLLAMTIGLMSLGVQAQTLDMGIKDLASKPIQGQVSISRDVNVADKNDKVSLNMREASVRDVLNILAKQGNFNIILDPTVTGSVTVDVKDISINKALEYVFTISDLTYTKDGNTVIVASKKRADESNLTVKTLKAIPVQYKDATLLANTLNNTIFRVARPGGSSAAVVAADRDSNSLLVLGTDKDIKLVTDALRELDMPRNRKSYHIKHNTPAYVASVLAANFFNNNGSVSIAAPAGSGVTSSSSSSTSTTTTSTTSTSAVPGLTTGSTGSQGTGINPTSANTASVSSFVVGGVTFISEPISATLTVLGTDEQLALIDSLIDKVDVRRPQVAIEVSLVEMQDSSLKTLVPDWSMLNVGRIAQIDLLNTGSINGFDLRNPFISRSLQFPKAQATVQGVSINHRNESVRGKVLANPTIVTLDGTAATINIADQVPTISQSNTIVNGVQTLTTTITTQSAGVTMTLTPQVFNDGAVVMNLQPNVSQPIRTVEATTNNGGVITKTSTVLLATRSMNLAGVRVQDGQTLVIGGLLRENIQTDINTVPGLDKLPIVSAMFRAVNRNDKDRTELVLMVTPHILKEEAVPYFGDVPSAGGLSSNMNQGKAGFQPVSLPKFVGSFAPDGRPDSRGMKPAAPESSAPASHAVDSLTERGMASSERKAGGMKAEKPVVQMPASKRIPLEE